MNQDFTVQKKQYLSEKKNSPEKTIPAQAVSEKKNSCKLKIPRSAPPPPRTARQDKTLPRIQNTSLNPKTRLALLLDPGMRFGFWEVFLDSGKWFVPLRAIVASRT